MTNPIQFQEKFLPYIQALGLLSVADWLTKDQLQEALDKRDEYEKFLTQAEKTRCQETVNIINALDGSEFFEWPQEKQESFLSTLEKDAKKKKKGFKN
tara:strand:- start:11 stop:304 length:294 start_codon:yes stop_codon:yes gene_type:complete